jgi:hypothetical protein
MESATLDLASFLRANQSRKVRTVGESGRVWELLGSSSTVERVRGELLRLALESRSVVLEYDADSPDGDLRQHVREVGPGLFSVHDQPPIPALRDWLYLGGWRVWSPAVPDSTRLAFADSPEDILRFIDENRVDFVIDSYPDDAEWFVGFGKNQRGASG